MKKDILALIAALVCCLALPLLFLGGGIFVTGIVFKENTILVGIGVIIIVIALIYFLIKRR